MCRSERLLGLKELGVEQIDSCIRGWLALTFPQQPQQAEQRIERVLGSVRQSKPIRLSENLGWDITRGAGA